MENSLQSVSGITAKWNKYSFILCLFALVFPIAVHAQENDEPSLSEKEMRRFNELFFMAEKEKNQGNLQEAKDIYEQLYKMDTRNATVCYELARIYGEEGKADDAVFYGERAAELDPENKWFKLLLASIYREFGKTDKEIELFEELISRVPDNPDYRYELAVAYQSKGELKKALSELDKVEDILGINEVITDLKKQIYLEMGDLEGAADEIRKLIKAYPRELDYYGTLGQIYQVNGYDKKAFEIYQKMLEISPDDPRPHLDLAEYYRQKEDYKSSLFHLKKAMASPDLDIDKKIPVLLSLFAASENDTSLRKESFEIVEQLIAADPEEAKSYAIYGDFLSREGRNNEALKAYKKAVELEGGAKFEIWEQILLIEIQMEMYDSLVVDGAEAVDLFPNRPLPYFFTGIANVMTGNAGEGIFYLEQGVNFVIGNPRLKEQFYMQLADAHHRLEQHSESDAYFDKVLTLNPQNSTALNNYAYYLSQRGEKLEKALEMTEKSNNLSPGNATFLDTWAWALYKNGQYKSALEKIEQIVQMSKEQNGEILEHYGDILLKNDQAQKALEQYKKAKVSGGASEEIDKKIKSLSVQ